MKRVTGIFEGEKIDLAENKTKDGKLVTSLYILSGHELIKMTVRDNELWKDLKAVPDREPVTIKAEVNEYKGNLYLQALALIS